MQRGRFTLTALSPLLKHILNKQTNKQKNQPQLCSAGLLARTANQKKRKSLFDLPLDKRESHFEIRTFTALVFWLLARGSHCSRRNYRNGIYESTTNMKALPPKNVSHSPRTEAHYHKKRHERKRENALQPLASQSFPSHCRVWFKWFGDLGI